MSGFEIAGIVGACVFFGGLPVVVFLIHNGNKHFYDTPSRRDWHKRSKKK